VTLPRKFLNEDEELLVEMRPHWVFFAKPLFTALAVLAGIIAILLVVPTPPSWVTDLLLVVAAIPFVWLGGRLLRWRNYTFALTSTRIAVRQGVFGRNTIQLRLQRITEINVEQKLWERMIGTGRLLIDVQGEDDAVVVEFVQKPGIVCRVINGQINELCGGGAAEPIPAELRHIGHRRRWSPPEPPRNGDTPPFGVPVVRPDEGTGEGPRRGPGGPSGGPGGFGPTGAPAGAPAGATDASPTAPQGVVVPSPGGPAGAGGPGGGGGPGVGGGGGGTGGGGAGAPDIRVRLIELDDLRQRGIISEEEFAAKKAELLSRI
jgi:membrane protein YdbS with pleckstrin-like domain